MRSAAAARLAPLLWLAGAATPLLVGALAGAQPTPHAEAGLGVALSYEAFAGCPAREAFVKNVESRRRGAAGAADAGAVRLEVRLRPAGSRVQGSIAMVSASGTRSARRIEASSCGEASDALALIAALALQGIVVSEVAPEGEAEERRTRRAPATSTPARAGRHPAGASDEASQTEIEATSSETEAAPPSKREAEADQTERGDPTELAEPSADPTGAASETSAEAKPETELEREAESDSDSDSDSGDPSFEPETDRTTSRAYALLSGGVASGVMPALQPLLDLALGLEHGAPGALLLSAQAGVRISPAQTRSFEMGVVTFGFWTGFLSGCLGARSAVLSAAGCAVLEAGALSGRATDTDNPQDELRAWVAAGPGLTLAYEPTAALRLQLRGEAITPLVRYRFELPANSAVHEPDRLELRALLGVGLRLW